MVYFICLIGYAVLCAYSFYKSKKIVNITFIHSALWLVLTALVLIMKMEFSESACLFLFFNSFLFFVGYSFLSSFIKLSPEVNNELDFRTIDDEVYRFDRIHLFIVILSILGTIYLAYDQGFTLSSFASISSITNKMHSISSSRYTSDNYDFSVVNRLINTVTTFGCAYEGYYFTVRKRKSYFILLVLYAIQGLLVSQKASLVYAFAFWLAGLITGMEFFHIKMKHSTIIKLIAAVLTVLFFSIFLNYFRHARQLTVLDEIQRVFEGYFVGPTAAFSYWFKQYDGNMEFGANTFSSIFRVAGIASQEHGVMVSGLGFSTNVYTVYKHLVSDYGIVLTCLISCLMGIVSYISDYYVKSGRRKLVGLNIVILTSILISFFTSLFRYTTTVISIVFIVIYTLFRFKIGNRGIDFSLSWRKVKR